VEKRGLLPLDFQILSFNAIVQAEISKKGLIMQLSQGGNLSQNHPKIT
jgi:hypothetical protein